MIALAMAAAVTAGGDFQCSVSPLLPEPKPGLTFEVRIQSDERVVETLGATAARVTEYEVEIAMPKESLDFAPERLREKLAKPMRMKQASLRGMYEATDRFATVVYGRDPIAAIEGLEPGESATVSGERTSRSTDGRSNTTRFDVTTTFEGCAPFDIGGNAEPVARYTIEHTRTGRRPRRARRDLAPPRSRIAAPRLASGGNAARLRLARAVRARVTFRRRAAMPFA